MEKTARTQLDKIFSGVLTNEFPGMWGASKCEQLVNLLESLKYLEIDISRNKDMLEAAKLKWKHLHEKLCDIESSKRGLLEFFLPEAFICDEDFFEYCIKVFQFALHEGLEGEAFFIKLEENVNKTQLIKAIKDHSQKLPNDVSYRYLHSRVLPAIFFSDTTKEQRQELCDLILTYPMGFAMQFMDIATQKQYKVEVFNRYIPFINNNGKLRDDWSLICKTIIHYSGKLLHTDTHMQNILLKFVEGGFKNFNIGGRCAALDCWRVLIDNYSLDRTYLTNPKQAALLLKPFRAKISRNRNFTLKKFHTYVHFLVKMDFAKVYLEAFFTDVFGPFEIEVADTCKIEMDSIGCFRELHTIYAKITEILLKTIGHNRTVCGCNKRAFAVTDIFKIPNLVLYETYNWDILVNSVRVCAQLNYYKYGDVRQEVIVKCLWSSLFKLLCTKKYKERYSQVLKSTQLAIAKILNSSQMNRDYYYTFFKTILKCVLDYLTDVGFDRDVHAELVLPMIKEMIMFQNNYVEKLPIAVFNDFVLHLCIYCEKDPNFFTTVDYLVQYGPYKCQLASDVFTFAVGRYINALDRGDGSASDETLKVLMANIVSINCYKHIETSEFERVYLLIQHKSGVLMQFLSHLLNNDPSLIFGVYKIATTFLKYVITVTAISDQTFYNFLLDVVLTYVKDLEHSDLDRQQIRTDTKILQDCLAHILKLRRQRTSLQIEIDKILYIYYHFIKLEHYDLLDVVTLVLDFAQKDDITTEFCDLIISIADSDSEASQKAFDVFAKLYANGLNCTQMPTSMKFKVLTEPVNSTPLASKSPNTVRLFGKLLDSPTSNKTRASVIEKTRNEILASKMQSQSQSPSTSANSGLAKHVDELSGSAFVSIDKEVVIDKDKLTQRQKEFVKDEHIPALYSELTQSQQSTDWMRLKESESGENGVVKNELSDGSEEDDSKRSGNDETERRTNAEIKKLRMNIVGEDEYFNLPRVRTRRSRNDYTMEDVFSPEDKHVGSTTKKTDIAACDIVASEENRDDIILNNDEQCIKTEKGESDLQSPSSKGDETRDKENDKTTVFKRTSSVRKKSGDEGSSSKKSKIRRKRDVRFHSPGKYRKSKRARSQDDSMNNLQEQEEKPIEGIKTEDSLTPRSHKKKSPKSDQRKSKTKRKDDHEEHKKSKPKNEEDDNDDGDNKFDSKNKTDFQTPLSSETRKESDTTDTNQDKNDKNTRNNDRHEEKVNVESENIIPASQDCDLRVHVFRLPSLSPTKKELDEARLIKEKMDTAKMGGIVTKIDFEKKLEVFKTPENRIFKSPPSSNEKTESKSLARRSKNKTSIETPPKPVDETLTLEMGESSQKASVDLDTESILCASSTPPCGDKTADKSTPLKAETCSPGGLESSPITHDTPSRTKELLDNTMDLSPIKICDKTHISPDLFDDGVEIDVAGDSNGLDVDVDAQTQAEFKVEEVGILKSPSSRSAKLLNMVGQSGSKLTQTRLVVENAKMTISSPTTDRIRKMMLNCSEANRAHKREQALEKLNPDDVLEFCNRPVPSPLALPKISILKRKIAEVIGDDGGSPVAKRKRVNFPDPPTTCEKVYFKVVEEKEDPEAKTSSKKKRVRTRLLAKQIVNGTLEKEPSGEDASDAIQLMQNQIDGLDSFEAGVMPLESSPTKDGGEVNGRMSPLPSNPAPELLGFNTNDLLPQLFLSMHTAPEPQEPADGELNVSFVANDEEVNVENGGEDRRDEEKKKPEHDEASIGDFNIDFCSGIFQYIKAKQNWDFETYLNVSLEKVPISVVEQWVKSKKRKQRGRPRKLSC